MSRPLLLLISAGVACSLVGCGGSLNRHRTIGENVRMDTLFPEDPQGVTLADATGEPSLKGVDRSHWPIRRFEAPIDDTLHEPIYTQSPQLSTRTRRQRGQHPTIYSAMQTTDREDRRAQAAEGVAAPVVAMLDVVLFIPRLLIGPQTSQVVTSPFDAYERDPTDESRIDLRDSAVPE